MKIIDREYSCVWHKECAYLMNNGFRYTFVKLDDKGVTTWKFKKSKELFLALADFYGSQRGSNE